ncbi:DUF4350 domain-containing protein [Piscinibacter sp. HJYY11]|uniref:DUF4350 domain-containing protein n=1 Tax=Piscinibacter sp. HJYY11 TaxID=2801333 RepID=UPI00191ED54D|nr:DUF4350 domain-containing protein [Piscinibacter sp. HJYY11]MBL0729329.1 DUF4350 domain-containing protein [Piscinibacter sp. HJYY11]
MTLTENQRTWGLRALLALLLAGVVAWLAANTEWVEVELPLPPRGEAARNRHHATQELLRRLGTTVAKPENLAQLPPQGATLLLTSWHWDFVPQRSQRLQQWVEAGGHLVLFSHDLNHQQLKRWLPVTLLDPERDEDDEDEDPEAPDDDSVDDSKEASPPGNARRPFRPGDLFKLRCYDAAEPDGVAPYYPGGARQYKLCGILVSGRKLQASAPVLWSIDGPHGPFVLRVAKGRGSVTVIQPSNLLDNNRVLEFDNGLATVAALQARRGAVVWFVAEEARPSLLTWLWQEAAAAVLLGAAALLLALWRAARRFGPLAASAPNARRSMTEQIAGTAQFLRQQGPEALLAAQIRALETAARNHIRLYDTLDRGQRAAAIARHTGQDAAALNSALDKSLARKRTDLPATLELLETARRLLVQKASPVSRPSKKD